MSKDSLFPGLATAIGSLPHTDMEAALDLVIESLPDCPHWPQLQSLSYTEKMEVQPVEGLPGVRHLPEKKSVYVDTRGGQEELAGFYEKAMAAESGGDYSEFALSEEYGRGIHAFAERLESSGIRPAVVKGQLIGPFSFGFSITDQDGKAILYDPVWADVCMRILAMKSLWQIKLLGKFADSVLFFLDEPMLSAYGSTAMLTVDRDEVLTRLNQVIVPLKDSGAIVGMHCCGNTDWGLVMESSLDMLNFDAYTYGSTLGIYAKEANAFMDRGGRFAAGIIPTLDPESLDGEDAESLLEKLKLWLDEMGRAGIDEDRLKERCVITPACGCGTLSEPRAENIYDILKFLQKNYPGI